MPRFTIQSDPTSSVDLTVKEALQSSSFWLLSLVHASPLLIVGAVLMHQIPHMIEGIGLTVSNPGTLVMVRVICTVCGQAGGGFLGDRVDKRVTVFV